MKKVVYIFIVIILVLMSGCNDKSTQDVSPNSINDVSETVNSNLSNDSLSQEDLSNSSMLTHEENDSYTYVAESYMIDFTPICQYPELPTGCEVTSLAMVLNYYNVDCDKCEIADNYLSKGEVGTVDFHKAFEGDPRDEYSFGCYSNVIVETANKILADKSAMLYVGDYTGSSLEDLYPLINKDIPIIVWGTQDCQEGHFSVTWNVDGEDLTWFTPEHCMVLMGYDETSVWVADPIYGDIRSYEKDTFERSYDSLFQQAVVIKTV